MVCAFTIDNIGIIIANYRVTRPAVARVINEDNYNTGVVRYYVSNGSVVFSQGESYSTIWPGTYYICMRADVCDTFAPNT